jgi:hypothetical protein
MATPLEPWDDTRVAADLTTPGNDSKQLVFTRRTIRPGETPQREGYGYIDGYLVTLADLADPEPGGLTNEVSATAQRRIADTFTLSLADSTTAAGPITAEVVTQFGDRWEFAINGFPTPGT